MSNRNIIQDELNQLNSKLNPNPDPAPYSVPDGYFDGFAASVLAKIKGEMPVSAVQELAELSPLLAGISRTSPYSVPEGYFQSNINGLKAFIENEESLVLSFIDKEMPYDVPTGYFANVPEQVLERISKKGKVVPMFKRNWMRLAVAAMLIGIIVISGIGYFYNRGGSQIATNDPVAVVKKASTEELNEFIKTTAVDEKTQITAQNSTQKTETKKLFADVSDNELNAFLDQMPAGDEIDIN